MRGFTLIELLVVIVILAILAGISFSIYGNALRSARQAKRVSDFKEVMNALELYRGDNEHYPLALDWRSQCLDGGHLAPENVIPGLVPEYIRAFPADPDMEEGTNTSCYMYISTETGDGYKLLDYKISNFTAADYKKFPALVDPARDGGANLCKVDGDTIDAWAFYTNNACAL